MAYKFYFYVTSKHPWLFHGEIHQRYRHYKMTKFSQNEVTIEPLDISSNDIKFEGIFRILHKYQGENLNSRDDNYDNAIKWLKRFLNLLTIYCQHGFKELDQHCYSKDDSDINNNLRLIEDSLPQLRKSTSKKGNKRTTQHNLQQALQNTQQLPEVEKNCPDKCKKIENALSFLRLSYFAPNERIRYIMRFTALECLTERRDSQIDKNLIRLIKESANKTCKENNLQNNQIDKICGHIGQLSKESIKGSIKRLLHENQIVEFGFTAEDLYETRNKIVHEGREIMDANNSSITHRYCVAVEHILTPLLQKLLSTLISSCQKSIIT